MTFVTLTVSHGRISRTGDTPSADTPTRVLRLAPAPMTKSFISVSDTMTVADSVFGPYSSQSVTIALRIPTTSVDNFEDIADHYKGRAVGWLSRTFEDIFKSQGRIVSFGEAPTVPDEKFTEVVADAPHTLAIGTSLKVSNNVFGPYSSFSTSAELGLELKSAEIRQFEASADVLMLRLTKYLETVVNRVFLSRGQPPFFITKDGK